VTNDIKCLRCGQSTHMVDECQLPVLPDSRVLGPATSRTLEKEMNTQPDAHRLADALEKDKWHVLAVTLQEAADLLRTQHAAIERLTAALKKANDQTEHFEREWYLRGDAIERKDALLRRLITALDMDRHDVDGWPSDSCEAVYAIQKELAK